MSWFNDGKFVVDGAGGEVWRSSLIILLLVQKCTLTENWMTDGQTEPTSDAVEEGYGSWLGRGCSSCIRELRNSNLLKITDDISTGYQLYSANDHISG